MKTQNIEVGLITIQVEKLDPECDLLSLNFDENGKKLKSFNYKWVHLSGLQLLTPSHGTGFTIEDCIQQAKDAMGMK